MTTQRIAGVGLLARDSEMHGCDHLFPPKPGRDRAPGDRRWERVGTGQGRVPSGASKRKQFLSAAPHRRGIRIALAILGDSAASNIDPLVLQKLDDTLVREGAAGGSPSISSANSMANRLRRMRAVAIRCRDRRIEEIFELVDASWRGHVFVARHPADRTLVHADRIGDVAQDQRSQRRYAVTKEGVLVTNDLCGNLEDRGRTLVQRFYQPIRGVEALGKVILLSLAAGRLADPGIIPVVDQDARQGFGVELDDPAALGLRPQQDIGHHGLRQRRIESESRPRVERFDLGDHIGDIHGIDAAHPDQRGDVAGGEQRQVIEQSLHCGIEPIPVAQLQSQTLFEITGEDAGWIELLETSQDRLDPPDLASQELCHTIERRPEIARFIEQIEEMHRDDPVALIAQVGTNLLKQVFAQGARPGCSLI